MKCIEWRKSGLPFRILFALLPKISSYRNFEVKRYNAVVSLWVVRTDEPHDWAIYSETSTVVTWNWFWLISCLVRYDHRVR